MPWRNCSTSSGEAGRPDHQLPTPAACHGAKVKRFNLRDVSVRWKVTAIMFVVLTLSLLLVGGGLLVHAHGNFKRSAADRLTMLANVVGQNSTAAIAFRDQRAAQETLASLANDRRIMAAGIYEQNGQLFARYRRASDGAAVLDTLPHEQDEEPVFANDRITIARPVEWKGEVLGRVYLIADTSEWTETRQALIAVLLTLFGAVLAVGFVVLVGLQRLVSRPVEELANLMRRIARQRDFGLRAIKRSNDEIGVLVDGFNQLLDEVGARRAEAERAQQELKARVEELDTEVKERRHAEAALLRSREQLQDFIENANVGMNWLSAEGTILWANRGELELLGYASEEYIGHHVTEFYADRAAGEQLIERINTDGVLENFEARLRCKDGTVRHALINANVYRENGEFVHARCFIRDITVRKNVEDALRRSEERYRTLVAATTSVVFGANSNGAVVQRLPSWEDYTGQTFDEYRDAGWLTMVHPEDRSRVQAAWQRAIASGHMFAAEMRVWHAPSRRHRYCSGRAVALQADGSVSEWIGTMTDIDDRKRAEEQFRIAVEGAPIAMIMIDAQGRIVLINRQLEALFGYARDEIVGQPVERLVPERARRGHPGYRANFFRDPHARPMGAGRDLYGRHKDGREIPVEIGLSPFTTEEGSFVLASVIDISERQRAEQDLRRYTDELQRSNRELGQFAYVASHDLQEPLRAISGCVQLLQQRYRDRLDARANELIEHTVSGALRMQALINDLLSYSRVSTRARPFELTDLNQPLQQALANLEFAIKEAKATITTDPMPLATVDPTQVAQLFQNLIGNAVKFRTDVPPKVHVGAEPRQGGYVFRVSDNGIGIEPQYIERIFGVFQRLHNRNKYPGNGIGLAICRKIIERHNGRIWVESAPGKGATFYFTLPSGNVHNVEQSERYGSQQLQ